MPITQDDIKVFRFKMKAKEPQEALKEIPKMDKLEIVPIVVDILQDIQKLTLDDIAKYMHNYDVRDPQLRIDVHKFLDAQTTDSISHDAVANMVENLAKERLHPHKHDNSELLMHVKNDICLRYAIKAYSSLKENQKLNPWGLAKKLFTYNEERIRKPLKTLVFALKNVAVLETTEHLWNEATLWLEGLYLSVFNSIPDHKKTPDKQMVLKDVDGTFISVDIIDKICKRLFHLTRFDLALYNKDISNELHARIYHFRNTQKVIENDERYTAMKLAR